MTIVAIRLILLHFVDTINEPKPITPFSTCTIGFFHIEIKFEIPSHKHGIGGLEHHTQGFSSRIAGKSEAF
jgi:hypothetical protein